MGNDRPRYWFPLALLGFCLLAMDVYSLLQPNDSWFDFGPYNAGGSKVLDQRAVAIQVVTTGTGPAFGAGPGIHHRGTTWLVLNVVAFLGTLAWYTFRARHDGRPIRPWRLTGLAVGGALAILLIDLTAFWQFRMADDVRGPLLAACGLVLLAWFERSIVVLVVAGLFALVNVVVFGGAVGALVAAAIAFAGAFAALLWTPRRRLSGNVENGPGEH